MKKILIMFMLCFSFTMANAQIATENRKTFDNVYMGVEIGATTPLDFNSIFPVNPVVGVKIGKEFTPVYGIEVEGSATFGDNFNRHGYESSTPSWWTGPFNIHQNGSVNTYVKATNVGLNGVINWSNLLSSYRGTPRVFEVKSNTGLSWLHYYGDYTPDRPIGGIKIDGKSNVLVAKTALDLVFNLGHKKAHSILVSPGIYWNLNEISNNIKFNKNYAQFSVTLGYVYHFKTSNGTHHFKTYDVGAMIAEIDRLNEELSKKPNEVVVEKVVKVNNTPHAVMVPSTYVIQFAQNSAELSDEAKDILDRIDGNVNIVASASPEGTKKYNQELSERRAEAVANYLSKRGIKITSSEGIGSVDNYSNRIAIVTSY